MTDLSNQVLSIVSSQPGLKAREISNRLGVDRKQVNSTLYGALRSKVRQDNRYRWYSLSSPTPTETVKDAPSKQVTPLANLCRYYLDCLSHDDFGGVSEFASSKYGDPKYVELKVLPMFNENGDDPFDSEPGRRLLSQVKRDRNRQTIYLGYPVRLNLIRSRKGWEGLMVEPLLLFSYKETEVRQLTPSLAEDLPQINFRALRSLSNTGEGNLMEEVLLLSEELGLGTSIDEQPDIDELLIRLKRIRPEWDWQEELDPFSLSTGLSLAETSTAGIYNRGILISAEHSPYTKGLETELGLLQSTNPEQSSVTALGKWLSDYETEAVPTSPKPLLEVLPLNSEQRQAVKNALHNPLTVITGPPGTGKSQVVTSILINAAWQGKTVLFASKNNKAVDVVEARANALGPRPVLLRLGSNQYQNRLAEYFISLLGATATDDDSDLYRECEDIHSKLEARSSKIDDDLQNVVSLRNVVDQLEQSVEDIRDSVGNEQFLAFRSVNSEVLFQTDDQLQSALRSADKSKQSIFGRIFWVLIRDERFRRVSEIGQTLKGIGPSIGMPIPNCIADSQSISEWLEFGERFDARVNEIAASHAYFEKLDELINNESLEDLSIRRKQLTQDIEANSEQLWNAWLALQPRRLTTGDRKLLGDYRSILQMIVAANDENRKLGRDIFRKYYNLFPKITSILSCWAVTSLSARGRIPFEGNFFDLLVIDEASQCDIASALPLLYRAKRAVIIGDPKQLRHISTLSKYQGQQLLQKHDLLDEFSGWSYSNSSLFDLASSLCSSDDMVALRDHHRSHADIIGFSNDAFYEGRLRIATNYDRLRMPDRNTPAVRWVNIQGRVERPGSGGAINDLEAVAVLKEIERLVSQGYRGTIGVVSPFRAQANRIRDLVYGHTELTKHIGVLEFLSDTVHKFQGDERDVMIFSPVVSEGISTGALSFLRNNANLFNVAITRARACLIVVGNKGAILNSGVDYLARFAVYSDKLTAPHEHTVNRQERDLGSDFPPVADSERVSEWEKILYRALYKSGLRPIPQYQVEKYALDLALIKGTWMLDIEVDGERYHRNWDGELCRRDQIRNQRLMELGWDVMRFWVYQIRDDLGGCVARVKRWHA